MSAAHPPGAAVVALGGGHGLAASLAALRRVTDRLTAVVTVGDDGGSSGRLRTELGALPPGDLRMALAALAGPGGDQQLWARALQHRFDGDGALGGHALGNLLLAGLAQLLGDPLQALAAVGRLVGAGGRVLPLCEQPLDIVAEVAGLDPARPDELTEVRGQHEVATTTGRVRSVRLDPAGAPACGRALAAVAAADWCVLGPGSWFTSVLPHLLVPDLLAALRRTPARRLVVVNLAPQHGETAGFAAETHLDVLAAHAPGLAVDVVLADRAAAADPAALHGRAAALGARLVLDDVAAQDGTPRHDPGRLAAAYRRIMDGGEARWR